jgi:hypothetical protein
MSLSFADQFHVQSNAASSPSPAEDQCHEKSDAPPTPFRVQSPKTMNEPPASNHRMKQHNVIESLLKSSTPPPSLSLPPSSMPITKKQTSGDDDPSSSLNRARGKHKPTKKKKKTTKQYNSQHKQQHTHKSAASLVVCGVDGTVFTLDAYTGDLRGMFASGPALVFSSDVIREQDVEVETHDAYGYEIEVSSASAISSTPRPWKERVVPGLDGRLYSLYEQHKNVYNEDRENNPSECHLGDLAENDDFLDELCNTQASSDENNLDRDDSSTSVTPRMDNYNLQQLPISVMDVVDSPISTCRPVVDFDNAFEGTQRLQCGIVVGSKKTTIYAIDPITGTVRWTQDPHGGGGAKGFTTGRPADARRKPTVLLQREDYAVRQLDTDSGDEVWKVELGRFSALDFDIDAHRQNNHDMNDDDATDDPIVGGGRGRGAAAAAASSLKDKQKSNMPPILGGGKKKFGSYRDEPEFKSDGFEFNYEHSNFRAFPSIAFGEVSVLFIHDTVLTFRLSNAFILKINSTGWNIYPSC